MFGDKPIAAFGYTGESRQMLVAPAHPFSAGLFSERTEHRVSAAGDGSIRLNELDGPSEILLRYFRKKFGNGLKRSVFDCVPRNLFPSFNPSEAEEALAVENQERFVSMIHEPVRGSAGLRVKSGRNSVDTRLGPQGRIRYSIGETEFSPGSVCF